MLNANPDQLVAIGAMINREWGCYGYRIVEIDSWSRSVTAATVVASDGSRFVVMADCWANTHQPLDHDHCPFESIRDDTGEWHKQLADEAERMHLKAHEP